MRITGKMSTFGGPRDTGVSPSEGLALIEKADLTEWWFNRLFLSVQPINTSGLARRLDPNAFYIAMRWSSTPASFARHPFIARQQRVLAAIPRETSRRAMFKCSANGKTVWAQGADWGPAAWTDRIADVSPGVAAALNLHTDDQITIEMFL